MSQLPGDYDERGRPLPRQPTPVPQQQGGTSWGGWNADNVFDSWDLNPLSQQTGVARDDLSQQRQAFLDPYMSQYRDAGRTQGFGADQGDQELYGDANFQNFVRTGQTPQGMRNATPTQQWNATPVQANGNQFYDLLMSRINQGLAVDRTDPNVRAQVDPFVAQQTRASRNYLDDIAEGGRGRPLNMQSEQRLASERLGQQAGLFEAEVIGREMSARRDEIAQALSLYGGRLTSEERVMLERELGYLNDRARTADRTTSNDQFLRELALREWVAGNEDYYRRAGL